MSSSDQKPDRIVCQSLSKPMLTKSPVSKPSKLLPCLITAAWHSPAMVSNSICPTASITTTLITLQPSSIGCNLTAVS